MIARDAPRIVRACRDRGYEISEKHAIEAWEIVSERQHAGYLVLPDDDEALFQAVRYVCGVDHGNGNVEDAPIVKDQND
jgi:hypothetical protein